MYSLCVRCLSHLNALSCQAALTGLLPWILHSVAMGIELVTASHLNEKKEHITWRSLTMAWDNAAGAGYTSALHQSRACAQHVDAGLALCEGQYSFHYTGDKGYAGTLFFSFVLDAC